MTRSFHNVSSKYNVLFNAKLSYESGLTKMEKTFRDDYTKMLPVFIYSDDRISKSIAPEMNKTIEKTSKLINRHSITEKPKKQKKKKLSKKDKEFLNKKEYTKWVDDGFLLMGKAHFHKHDFYAAIETFEYIIKEYSKETIKYDALIWLARIYLELGNKKEAKNILDQLDGDKKFPKSHLRDYKLTLTDYYLKQKDYIESIPHLQKAIKDESDKKLKARYHYILAQIFEQNKDFINSTINFEEVIKLNPTYEMSFNARINKARLHDVSLFDSKDIKKELLKMLKDDKNIDYQDQIYYSLANIYQKEGSIEEALGNYKLSVQYSVSNDNQKALSYIAIADYYFTIPAYKDAQAYYDSAVSVIDDNFPDYPLLYNKSKSLNELVVKLNIVEYEDSLQYVAAMSEEDRNNFILALIEELKEEEQRLLEEQKQNPLLAGQQSNLARQDIAGKWYFYNPIAIGIGQSEFTKIWGRRKLEDNWRRKNKATMLFEDEDELANNTDTTANLYNDKQPEYYLQELPLTDSLLKLSEERIAKALFEMARVYKEKLKDYKESIAILKDLNKRYPENENALAAYYYLYLLNNVIENEAAAEYYKRLIATEYPESQYASILTNPNYFKELEEKEQEIEQFYDSTYSLYLSNNFSQVVRNFQYADTTFADSKLISKFHYLKTLSIGKTQDVEIFSAELSELIDLYPESEVAVEAKDILAYINRGEEVVIEEESVFGDDELQEEVAEETNEEIYEFDKRATHFYMIIVENKKTDVNKIKFGIANFNIDYFSTLEFNVSSALLNDDFQFITVKSFKNRNQAMNYYESIIEFGDVLNKLDDKTYRHFLISSDNYVLFYQDKDIAKYYRFFKKNYLD